MNTILILLTVAWMGAAVNAIVCQPNFCDTVRCDNSITENSCDGIFKPNGGFCGCCPSCVSIIPADGRCFNLNGVPPKAQCIEGTRCVNGICQAYDMTC